MHIPSSAGGDHQAFERKNTPAVVQHVSMSIIELEVERPVELGDWRLENGGLSMEHGDELPLTESWMQIRPRVKHVRAPSGYILPDPADIILHRLLETSRVFAEILSSSIVIIIGRPLLNRMLQYSEEKKT